MVSPQCAPDGALQYNQSTQPPASQKRPGPPEVDRRPPSTQQQGQFKRQGRCRTRCRALPCCCCCNHDVSRPVDDGLGPAGAPVSSDTLVPTAQQDQQALYAREVAARVALVQSFDGVSGWLTHASNL
jgi:hypothetical protein